MNTSTDRTRFARALAVVGATNPGDAVFDDLMTRYREEHRHYHTAAHVEACVRHLCRFGALAENASEIELALWFHDAIYQTRSSDNEAASARWARRFVADAGGSDELGQAVEDHILATRHLEPLRRDSSAWVVDIDLGILGAPAAVYDRFEADIRSEYVWVPGPLFRRKRAEILRGFLERPSIYLTDLFRDELESRARENVGRAVEALAPRR